MTIGELITDALQSLGLVQPGDAVPAEMSSKGLSRLNDWIDGLGNDSLTVYQILRTTWALTGAASYSIGSGGTINVSRPPSAESIVNIGRVDTSNPANEVLLGRPMTEDQYASLSQKTLTGTDVIAWYYRPTFPLGTLIPWPIASAGSGVIYSEALLTEFAALTDTIALPPGYRRFFRTNLVVELADAFEVQPPQTTVSAASQSKAGIKRTNARTADLGFDPAMMVGNAGGSSNIYTGE